MTIRRFHLSRYTPPRTLTTTPGKRKRNQTESASRRSVSQTEASEKIKIRLGDLIYACCFSPSDNSNCRADRDEDKDSSQCPVEYHRIKSEDICRGVRRPNSEREHCTVR